MDEKLVTVATYVNPNEAELARMHLEGEGLTAFLADMETVTMDWLLGTALGNIKLQVPDSQAETAAAILAKLTKRRAETEEEEDSEEESLCLACGEEMLVSESKCPACGWSYEKEEG